MLILVMNPTAREYFHARFHSRYGLGVAWEPVSFDLPFRAHPEPALPDGLVRTEAELELLFGDWKKIPHPRPDLDECSNFGEMFHRLKCERNDWSDARSSAESN